MTFFFPDTKFYREAANKLKDFIADHDSEFVKRVWRNKKWHDISTEHSHLNLPQRIHQPFEEPKTNNRIGFRSHGGMYNRKMELFKL